MSTIHIDEAGQAAEFHDVVQSVSITHLLQQRDAVLERLAQAFRILQERRYRLQCTPGIPEYRGIKRLPR